MSSPNGEIELAWTLTLAAARAARGSFDLQRGAWFSLRGDGLHQTHAQDPQRVIEWRPGSGWQTPPAAVDAGREMLELYLPLCGTPCVFAHLGQSLDGFIATESGESHYVTGAENILHLHRLRALCDAIVVGAGTVAADDPRLTTRLVAGANPLRVVIDPQRRLAADHHVFADGAASTLLVCTAQAGSATATHLGDAEVLPLPSAAGELDLRALVAELRRRGCRSIFVEGGGATVSGFLQQGMLDRLQVTVAPLFIGEGRRGLRLPPADSLGACARPPARIFRMGTDVLFDCDLRALRHV